ncbi:tetratricopeptide repeat protein [Foetidibacter luteolus]|uniref:tetratricopeptide repeat protein n=1 Tax=Foetidibacter luteolus TaxID=2608880 RepID=UPI00129A9DAD|nr:tetratricopeptide repeat protein [Foetidibacter luteolus]
MNNHPEIPANDFYEIERYLLKEMTTQEQEDFEKKLSEDKTLTDSVNSTRLLILGVQEASLLADIQHFHNTLTQPQQQTPAKVFPLKKWLAAAAVIIAVAAGAFLLLGKNSNERLFAKYYKADPGLITAMSASDNYTFDRAMIDYKTGDYNAALQAWKTLLPAKPANDTLNYFIGTAYLALDKTGEAITHLQKVAGSYQSYFMQDACWYLGLAWLKRGQVQEAIGWIEKSGHPQKDALLQQLKK